MLWPALALAADPQITSFTDTPDPVPAGGVFEYRIRVVNTQVDDALNAYVLLTVPSGADFVSSLNPANNCVSLPPDVVYCDLGTVGGLGLDVRDIVLRWRATGPGPDTVFAQAQVSADNDTNPVNNVETAITTVISGSNLAITLSAAPEPVVGGANITYTLTARNDGPNSADDIVVTNNLPPSVSFVAAGGDGWTCNHALGVVTCARRGPHPNGAAIPHITLVGRVNAAGGTITNSASVAPALGGVDDPDTSDNTATVDSTVLPGADVNIAQKLVASGSPAAAGSDVTFVIQARNGGPAAAANVSVTDPLPGGWAFVSASGPNWACAQAAGTVSCTRAALPAGATDDITVVARAPAQAVIGSGAAYTNTATIAATSTDPDAGNNSASALVNVLPDGADLRLSKTKTPNPVAVGSPMTSSITVTNNGPRIATGPLRVVELLSDESFVSVAPGPWVCDASNAPRVVCTHPNTGGLAVNAALPVLSLLTRADAVGTATNTACTGNSVPASLSPTLASPPVEGDPNAGNDCAAVAVTATAAQTDLAISKVTSTPLGGDKTVSASENSVTYTLTVSNVSAGTAEATGVRIFDAIPAFIVGRSSIASLVAVPSAGSTATFNCTTFEALAECDQTGGSMRPSEAVTVTIVVNRPLREGTFSNYATLSNRNEGDPNPNNNEARDDVVIEAVADVEMTGKTVAPLALRAGEVATYVLSFRNNGPSPAQNVTVTDTFSFPAGDSGVTVTALSSSAAGSTCSIAPGAVLNPAAPNFNCTIGTMADGRTESITLALRPNYQPGNAARVFNNVARISTSTVEAPDGSDNGNNQRSAVLNVTAAALDLLINKTDRVGAVNLDPVPYLPGATFLGYDLSVTNNGPSYGSGVRVSETMTPPAGRRVRFVCDVTGFGASTCNTPSLCSATNVTSAAGAALPVFTCDVPAGNAATGNGIGEMAVGATKHVYLRFEVLDQPAPGGDVFNDVATVAANEPDTQLANNRAVEQTTTRQRVDIRTTKTATVAGPALRQPFEWLVRVENRGPGNALQTDLTDTLPAEAEVTGPITWTRTLQPGNGNCTLTGRVVSCALGRLDAGGEALVRIPVRVTVLPTGGSLSNTATVDTDPIKLGGLDLPGGNNTGSSTLTVQTSSLAGLVFQDRVRDGPNGGTPQAAAAEPRIVGVTVTLSGTDAYGNAVNRSTVTDASGNYRFDLLSPSAAGGYTLTQTQPAGFVNGPVAPPGGLPGGSYAGGGASGNSSWVTARLDAGVAGAGYDFPELRRATLAGFVYIDINGNGVRDAATDPAIAGATVRLLDAATGAVVATTSSAADGSYAFSGLDPLASYTLEQPLPAAPAGLVNGPVNPGLIDGAACAAGCTAQPDTPAAGTDRIAAIDLSAGSDGSAFNFGERALTAISGTVYIDRNRDGAVGPGEAGIGGVTLRLVAGGSCAGTLLATTTTDAAGNYIFSAAAAGGSYTVCQTQPVGYGDGATQAGSGGAVSGGSGIVTIANLPPGGSTGNNFGEFAGSIGGSVYLDANNDGVRQGGESGIAGVTVTLTGTDAAGNAVSRTAVSDAAGAWRFDDLLAAGALGYTVTEQAAQPVVGGIATLDGRSNAGTVAGTSAGAAGAVGALPSRISGIGLPAGGDSIDNRFGEVLPVSISGSVFIDLDNNGLQNLPADTALAGIALVITGTDDTGAVVTRNTVTAADGRYAVTDLRPGTYTVTEPTQPAGTRNGITSAGSAGGTASAPATLPSAIAGIVLTLPGSSASANNFAEMPVNSSLAGRVWLDLNRNGVIDGPEVGIAGVTIELSGVESGGGAVTRSTVTDATGAYLFDALAPGSYTLREPAQPAGTVNGATVAGSAGGAATTPATLPSAIATLTLGAGVAATGNDFGEWQAASLAGMVFADSNDNGGLDLGEAGLAGVQILLTGTDDLGQAVSLATVTGADGRYRFGNLRPGNYTLTEPTQPAGTVNGRTAAGSAGGTATAAAVLPSSVAGIALAAGVDATAYDFAEIGSSPDLRVSKTVVGGAFTVGFSGSWRISVRNVGDLPSSGSFTVNDRLPAGLTLAATPGGPGWACTGAVGASAFSCSRSSVLATGATLADVITVSVDVAAAAAAASPVDNAVLVEGGGESLLRAPSAAVRDAFNANPAALPVCTAAIEHDACRTPTPVQLAAAVSGTVWHDTGSSSRLLDSGDRRLAGWQVEAVDPATGAIIGSAVTGTDGRYRIPGLLPSVTLALRFRDPASGVVFGYPVNGETAPGSSGVGCSANATPAGQASSCVGSGATPALTVVLRPGEELAQQSLPVDPSGVVYDAVQRLPVPGAVVTLAPVGACAGWNPATGLVAATLGGYTVNGGSVSMTVGADGFYQFLFAPAAPALCTFGLSVAPPAGFAFVSTGLPPAAGPFAPGGGPGATFAVQPQAGPPVGAVGSATTYYLTLNTGSSAANVIHNHIPLDPALPGGIALSKTGDKAVAEIGDSVRYTLTVRVTAGALPLQTTVVDRLPAGFTYIPGTAMVGDTPIADPAGGPGPTLAFQLGPMPATKQLVLRYRLRVGVGAQRGDGINRAIGQACGLPAGCVDTGFTPRAGAVATNEASYRVRVGGGVFTTDACVLGKIFVDCNGNHVQDDEELGIPGVRLFMQDGSTLISDSEGKYSLCGVPPRSAVLKVDPQSLPRGARLTTSSNRNLGDAGSLWLDIKNGELHRADFIEGSCSNTVLDQIKARRAQGEVRAPERERPRGPALRFDSKAHGLTPLTTPQQGSDSANQPVPRPRDTAPGQQGGSDDAR